MTDRRAVRRLIAPLVCAVACLAAASAAGAAQSIGATDRPGSITVSTSKGRLVVRYIDLQGDTRYVIATAADRGAQEAALRYADAPPQTARPCYLATALPTNVLRTPGTRGCSTLRYLDGEPVTWLVQPFAKRVPDFGGDVDAAQSDIYISRVRDPAASAGVPTWAHAGAGATTAEFALPPLGTQRFDGYPQLLAYPRWSKFSPGGYAGYLKERHFPVLFGSLTMSGIGVYGPGNRYGAPTTSYGRNVYIDTLDSDYGSGWHRIMGVLTQPPNGTWCYELGPKGASGSRTGQSRANRYSLTAIGPGLHPVVRVETTNPPFAFGGPGYNPKVDTWGHGFSDGQAQALRDQMAMIGPGYVTKPAGRGSTDCGATLRQLPTPF